jgi:hypothetical protein
MTSWSILADELARWGDAGLVADLWWRDDDAIADTPALRRLLEIAEVPVALAVIPGKLQPSLAAALVGRSPDAPVLALQHGFHHQNHEPAGRKKAELGAARDSRLVLADLRAGASIMAETFGKAALPVLTPPWNRIAPAVIQQLPNLGFRGLSTYLPRRQAAPVPGLLQVNTHVDIIDWHGGRQFIGADRALSLIAGHLRARRLGEADCTEPTGLLTHHLVQDDASWSFLSRLQDWLSDYPVLRWLTAQTVFAVETDRN